MKYLLMMALCLLSMSCESKQQKDSRFKTVEYIKVDGICKEDHVKPGVGIAEYSGFIDRYIDKQGNTGILCNMMMTKESSDKMFANITKNPTGYAPPVGIRFINIPEDQIKGDRMIIKGISTNDNDHSYPTTCDVTVVERLDHWPESGAKK